MAIPDELVVEFVRHFERGLSLWEQAMATGNTGPLEEKMPLNITCYFGPSGQDPMDVFDRTGIVAGMRQSVAAGA